MIENNCCESVRLNLESVILKDSAKRIMDYLDKRPGGCSFWIDEEGKNHSADLGYVYEFLEDFYNYMSEKEKKK